MATLLSSASVVADIAHANISNYVLFLLIDETLEENVMTRYISTLYSLLVSSGWDFMKPSRKMMVIRFYITESFFR